MVGVLHLLTLKIQKTLNKSFAKLYQASVALLGSQNRESIGNSSFIQCVLAKKQGIGLGGDISKVVILVMLMMAVVSLDNFAKQRVLYCVKKSGTLAWS